MTQYIHVHVRNLLMSVFVNVCHAVSTLCLPLSSEVKTLVSWIQNRAQQMNRETLKGESTQSGLQWSYIIVWMQHDSLFDTHYYHNFVLTSAVSDKISHRKHFWNVMRKSCTACAGMQMPKHCKAILKYSLMFSAATQS